jgi:hypothetical protein
MILNRINKLDSMLKEAFGSNNVEFKPLENQKNFKYEFTVEKNNYKVIMTLNEHDIMSVNDKDIIKWSYFTNSETPAKVIERASVVNTLSMDVDTIFEKKMFEQEYVTLVESIVEDEVEIVEEETNLFEEVENNILVDLNKLKGELSFEVDNHNEQFNRLDLFFSDNVKYLEKLKLEQSLGDNDLVDSIWFTDDKLSITFTKNVKLK